MNANPRMKTIGRRGGALLLAGLVGFALAPAVANACAVCYGDPDSALAQGMNNGILVLLGVVALVQLGFVVLFLSIRQRSRQQRRRKERFHVIEGGVG